MCVWMDGVFLGLAGLLLGNPRPSLLLYLDSPNQLTNRLLELLRASKYSVLANQPTVHIGGVNRGRLCGVNRATLCSF